MPPCLPSWSMISSHYWYGWGWGWGQNWYLLSYSPSCPLDKYLSNCSCPGQVVVNGFVTYSMTDDLPGPFPTRQVRIESYLPNMKIPDDQMAFFFQALDNIIVIDLVFLFPTLGMMNRETTALTLLWASLISFCPQIKRLLKSRTFARILFCHWQQRLPNTLIYVEEYTGVVVFLWKEVGGDDIFG